MSGEWDGLRAAAEAAPAQTVTDVTVTGVWLRSRHHLTVPPATVLEILDRLQAAEAAVERVRDFAGSLYWHGGGKGPDLARAIRSALDGPQGDATGEVALGYTDVLRVPEKPPGWHEAEALCRGCPFCDSDHGGRRDGEGLG